jgi:hypothetical protein
MWSYVPWWTLHLQRWRIQTTVQWNLQCCLNVPRQAIRYF